jgi:Ca2+-binding RTX toxin-like protein
MMGVRHLSPRRWLVLGIVTGAATLAAGLLVTSQGARAAFPGSNGKLAYTFFSGNFTGNGQTTVANADGTSAQDLSSSSDNDVQPAWSADGKKLAFTRMGVNNQIWVMNADGSGKTNVSNNSFNDQNPAWSPDGSKIVFRSNASGSGNQIWVMNSDGTGRVQLTTGTNDSNPRWSPDGTKILYSQGGGGFRTSQPLVVMNADGSGQHQVATGVKGDWSPDGTKIVYAQFNATNTRDELHVINADGTADHTVLGNSTDDYDSPVYSPDGSQVAYVDCGATFCEVGVAHADGSSPHTVTGSTDTGPDTAVKPDWQPAAPTFATAPTIGGSAVNGQTLTVTPGTTTGGATTSFQWLRCDTSGNGCVPIVGATGTTYKLTTADIGHTIRVRQTVTNAAGATTTDSAPTKIVAPNPARCSNVFVGTSHRDIINGTIGGDRISGLGGSDILNGGAGRDCLLGGNGNDKLSGGTGNDSLSGGAGKDKLSGGVGNDTLSGGSGNDAIAAGQGRNKVSGGAGNDRINTVNGKRDRVNCGSGKDVVHADKKDKLRNCERVLITRQRKKH